MSKPVQQENPKATMGDVVRITCYRRTEVRTRKEAMMFYLEGALCSEGSEQERYMNILRQLFLGYMECNDLVYA
jgi:hypothetical protein